MCSDRILLKQNPPKFLLKHLLAFLLKFAPMKVSCYTVVSGLLKPSFLFMEA